MGDILGRMPTELPKTAGLGELLKTPIPGTKDWLVNTGKSGLQGATKMVKKAPLRPAASGTFQTASRAPGTRTMSGVTHISEDELKRLGFGDLAKTSSVMYQSFSDELRKLLT